MNLAPRDIALEYVLHTHHSVFLTGKAGTGKTTLLKEIIKKTDKNCIICAPTGVAAINAGGMTIHSLFQLPSTSFLPGSDTSNYGSFTNHQTLSRTQKFKKDRIKLLVELELLIIDEISMVRADVLDAIDFVLRRFRKTDVPFGGVQMFVIGDLFQLAPVVHESEWRTLGQYYESPFFFDAHSWRRSAAITVTLEKIYRQEDQTFVDTLNRIRTGTAIEDDIALLNDRVSKVTSDDIITLTTHNNKARKINQSRLADLESESFELEANVSGRFNDSAYPVAEILELKKGAQVMFVRNHSEGLYFNGMIGTIVDMTGDLLKVKSHRDDQTLMIDQVEWKNVQYKVDPETKEIKPEEVGSFKQYPLKLAWAITVHKSQGLTFDELALDLADTFAAGQLYVALSRGRTLEGLFLKSKISLDNVIADQKIVKYFEEQAERGYDMQHLANAKASYEDDKLLSQWDLKKLLIYVEICQEQALDLDLQDELKANQVIYSVHEEVEKLEKISAKFQLQLRQLVAQYKEQDDILDQIIDRCYKGIGYFTDQMGGELIPKLESHEKDFSKKKGIKSYYNALVELIDECWRIVDAFYNMTYRGIELYKSERKHKRTKYFDPRPAKRVKGATYLETLELFNEGNTIQEIATIRDLAVGTIESHMGKLLADGKVDIEQLMNHKRIKKIKPYVLTDDYDSFTELMQRMPFKVSYSELRWVKTFVDMGGGVDE